MSRTNITATKVLAYNNQIWNHVSSFSRLSLIRQRKSSVDFSMSVGVYRFMLREKYRNSIEITWWTDCIGVQAPQLAEHIENSTRPRYTDAERERERERGRESTSLFFTSSTDVIVSRLVPDWFRVSCRYMSTLSPSDMVAVQMMIMMTMTREMTSLLKLGILIRSIRMMMVIRLMTMRPTELKLTCCDPLFIKSYLSVIYIQCSETSIPSCVVSRIIPDLRQNKSEFCQKYPELV